jgi:hypothetical protein
MRPREFDDLIRQKFDENDFAYNARNWDSLAEQMDGRAKKRSMLLWLWMPAAGMAASVALAIGVTTLLRFGNAETTGNNSGYAHTGKFEQSRIAQQQPIAMIPYTAHNTELPAQRPTKKATKNSARPSDKITAPPIGLKLHHVLNAAANNNGMAVVHNHAATTEKAAIKKIAGKEIAAREGFHTFRQETQKIKKPLNLSVILSGGVSQGSGNSGYMAGATVRKMITDKVYVESDVAFTSSDNTQRTQYMSYDAPATGSGLTGSGATAAKPGSASKTTDSESGINVPNNSPVGVVKTQDISYNLYYAQVTPSIGYKLMKRMSIGMGPDFQKMLIDNRPATSEVDRGNLQVAPTFDVGFVGKTEYALTQRVKAAISYRKGINGVINPSDKFIDRDYVQFQMRCTIFNR